MSDCMCGIDASDCDCEPWEWVRDSTPVACRQHVCAECERTIEPGEIYLRIDGLVRGNKTPDTEKV